MSFEAWLSRSGGNEDCVMYQTVICTIRYLPPKFCEIMFEGSSGSCFSIVHSLMIGEELAIGVLVK